MTPVNGMISGYDYDDNYVCICVSMYLCASLYMHIYTYICICVCVCVYLLIYTPLPNSRWLLHTALRYVRRVQLGAYTWRKGLNSITTGSKWAQNTCLRTPNGPGSLLEKHIFDPFFTRFCSQNGPFSRHIGIFHGPRHATMRSKRAKNTCLSIPNGLGSLLEKRVFDPFLTHFLHPKRPLFEAFWDFPRPKMRHHELKMG